MIFVWYTVQPQLKSSQTIGARVLSSHGEDAPVTGFSSIGNDNNPDTPGMLFAEGSWMP